jgi:predicted chitinase
MNIYFGIVENRSDPLELGRCQVRVVGLHTHDKNLLPTSDLPWCAIMQPSNSAAMNGIGFSYVGPVEGTSVVVTYLDDSMQQGLILGAVGGIATEPVPIDFDDSGPIIQSDALDKITLRSIPGKNNGNKITVYDPIAGRTDITNKLQANMRVVGYGIQEGTTIISIDSGTEITISSVVRDFGENIIEFLPPLSNTKFVAESKTAVVSATERNVSVKSSPTNNDIPTIPPPNFKTTTTKATEGIKAIIAACDKVGLTTKEQKCALLGIAGGESGWVPQEEAYNYTESRLKQVFSFATPEDIDKYSNATKKGVSRKEFFSWCYGPTKRGKGFFGHLTDEEAGNYYGRGFIQLTGKSNYKRYADKAKALGLDADILNNPDLLVSDIEVSAIISALYIKDRVSSSINPNAHPDYFYAAKKAVGVNTPDIAARKLSYYEYFYGVQSSGGFIKDAGAASPGEPLEGISTKPGPSNKSITSGSFGIGFRDPNNKYPLKEYIGESDVNRLARGVIEGTVVKLKDSTRITSIPKGVVGGVWDQPPAPYGAKYPYNKVFETESGHVQEFDDTPGQERVHTYHRSGTFTEVDANGTQVNYIVGDNFILMEQNGCIHVAGECNITVDGNTNIFARSDANIEVAANANVVVGNNMNIGAANDINLVSGDNVNMKVSGKFNLEAGEVNIKSQADLNVQATAGVFVKGDTTNVEATGDSNYLSGGTTNMDYGQGNFGMGASGSKDLEDLQVGPELTVPAAGSPLNSSIKYSIPPERQFEERAVIETPDDWDTPEGRSTAAKVAKEEGIDGAPAPVATDSSAVLSGGSKTSVAVDTSLILTTKDFTNDYRLSKNISLGMMISGGVGGKHRLTPQMLKINKNSPERLYTVQEIVSNLAETANNVLEPCLESLPGGISGFNKQWTITSGYRLKGVVPNESATSDHCKGHCIDIALIDPDKNNKTYALIQVLERLVPYDQMILEYRYPSSVWMHISYRKDNNRRMAFTMVNDSTYKRNEKGIPYGFYLIDSIPPKGK